MSVIETIELKTIHDLHDFLSPAGVKKNFFAKEEQYLFRGEESNQYRLNPSLFRSTKVESLYRSLRLPPLDSDYYQLEETYQWIELKTLLNFFRLANNAAIDLPTITAFQPSILTFSDHYHFQDDAWLPNELLELFSLARHYSLPTRMLDWSDNIYTALYFACSSALKWPEYKREDGMAIYALRSAALQKTDFPMRFIRPLRFYNRNAHAQGGVLSYLETKNLLQEKNVVDSIPPLGEMNSTLVNKKPLDERLEDYFSHENHTAGPFLHKSILDSSMIADLYLYLDSLHYSAEKIFPDLYGVVRKMLQDDANWNRKVHNEKTDTSS